MCCCQPTFSVNHSCKRTFSLLSSRKSSGLTVRTSVLCMMARFACLLEKLRELRLCSQNWAHLLFSLINFVWLVYTFKPVYSTFVYSEHDAWRCSSGCTQLVMSQWVLCFWQLMGNTFRWHHSLGGGWTLIAAHKLTKAFPVSGVGFRQTPSRRGWTGWRSSTRLFWTFTRGIEPKQRVSRQTRPAVGTWGRVYCNTSLRHLLGCASGFTLHLRVFASLTCVSLIYLWEIFFFPCMCFFLTWIQALLFGSQVTAVWVFTFFIYIYIYLCFCGNQLLQPLLVIIKGTFSIWDDSCLIPSYMFLL